MASAYCSPTRASTWSLASIAALQRVIFGVGLLQDLVLATVKRLVCPWALFESGGRVMSCSL